MRHRHYKKEKKNSYLAKLIIAVSVVAVVAVSSIVGVMANTIPCIVVDGENSYSFSLLIPDTDGIVAKAVEEGMSPLSEDDKVVVNEETGTINIYRAKSVIINYNGEFYNTLAYEYETVEEILKNNSLSFGKKAEIDPSLESKIGNTGLISIDEEFTVTVFADGKTKSVNSTGGVVGDAVEALGHTVDELDKLNYSLDTKLTDGMAIKITRANKISLTVDGNTSEHTVYGVTVSKALEELSVELGAEDIVSLGLKDKISNGMAITIERVEYKESVETEVLDYETVYEYNNEWYTDETETKTEGIEGEKEVTYRELYKNGEFVEKKAIKETVTKEATAAVVIKGTKEYPSSDSSTSGPVVPNTNPEVGQPNFDTSSDGENTFVDFNGNTVAYTNVMYGSGTAAYIPGGTTSIGLTTDVGIVAVNPYIIPYGTRMYIVADGLVYGYGIAGDTGGALMSGEALVDVYYNSLEECYNFGRRNCTVYILA